MDLNIDMNKDTLEVLLAVAVPALIILISWLARLLAALIEVKVTEIKQKIKNDKIKNAIDIVAEDAINIVYMLNQTIVDGLKEGSLDGKLTIDDANNIKAQAFNMLINTLSQDVKDTITDVYGNLDTYLNNVIEKCVVKAKVDSAKKNTTIKNEETVVTE